MEKVFVIMSQTKMGDKVLEAAKKSNQILFGFAPFDPKKSSSIIVSWNQSGQFDVICRFTFDETSIKLVEDMKKLMDIFLQKDDADKSPESFALFLEYKGFRNITNNVSLVRQEDLKNYENKDVATVIEPDEDCGVSSDFFEPVTPEREEIKYHMLNYKDLFGKEMDPD